jgi:hypothetical protein
MFAAYKIADENSTNVEPTEEFLQNPSYNSMPVSSSTICQVSSSDSENGSSTDDGKVCEVARRRSPSPKKVEYFYEDRQRKKEYLKLTELPHRAVPSYKIGRNFKRFAPNKKKVFRRYFNVKRIKKLALNPIPLMDEKVEKDEAMRIHLIKNSQEIDKWIDYIDYKVVVNILCGRFLIFFFSRKRLHWLLENRKKRRSWKSLKKRCTSIPATSN